MIMRKLKTEVSMTRRLRLPSAKPTKLAQRMEALQEAARMCQFQAHSTLMQAQTAHLHWFCRRQSRLGGMEINDSNQTLFRP